VNLVRDDRTLAAELERRWEEQWQRAKEICDLLEEAFGTAPLDPGPLRLVVSSHEDREPADPGSAPPALRLAGR
jgi:hypothetical protein